MSAAMISVATLIGVPPISKSVVSRMLMAVFRVPIRVACLSIEDSPIELVFG